MKKTLALLIFSFFAFTMNAQETANDTINAKTYSAADKLEVIPAYPGGMNSFYREYLIPKVQKIKTKFTGQVYISFVVDIDGSVSVAKATTGDDTQLNNQLLKIITDSPKWSPAMLNGKPVRYSFNIPINFYEFD